MTTVDGRLDDPMAWVHGVSDDQYREIDAIYSTFDTVLVGRTTYQEMAAYWPGALADDAGTATNRRMARRMHDYRKLVFSRTGGHELTAWNNAELVVAGTDDELAEYLTELKAQPGGDIHLSGGATFAGDVIRLDLVDEYRFFVYPVVSPGASWFAHVPDQRQLSLLDVQRFENGVIGLHYAPSMSAREAQPATFSDLLT